MESVDEGKFLIDLGSSRTFEQFDDAELAALIELAHREQKDRALEKGDLDALVEEGFEKGFNSNGTAKEPWLKGGLLVCMGSRIDRSSTSHTCSFAHIGESWVWESEDKIYDVVRNIPGPKVQMRSVTIVAVHEGMEIDQINSRTKGGIHEMVSARSYSVKGDDLTAVSVRARKAQNHR